MPKPVVYGVDVARVPDKTAAVLLESTPHGLKPSWVEKSFLGRGYDKPPHVIINPGANYADTEALAAVGMSTEGETSVTITNAGDGYKPGDMPPVAVLKPVRQLLSTEGEIPPLKSVQSDPAVTLKERQRRASIIASGYHVVPGLKKLLDAAEKSQVRDKVTVNLDETETDRPLSERGFGTDKGK